ncbi:unnamed protein product, partial [Polarella glacialis]
AVAPLGDDPQELEEIEAAREELRSRAVARLKGHSEAADAQQLGKALKELADLGIVDEHWSGFQERHGLLEQQGCCRRAVAQAAKARDKAALAAALKQAEGVGLTEDSDKGVHAAREVLKALEAQERHSKARAEASEELRRAAQGEDQRRLIAALEGADAASIAGPEVASARERLRNLRARA